MKVDVHGLVHIQVEQGELHSIEKNAALQQLEEHMTNLALQEREGTHAPSWASNQTSAASSHFSDMLPGLNLSGLEVDEQPSQEPLLSRSDMVCVVCMEREKKVVLLPCKHMCMCKVCTDEILAIKAQCPVCREPVVDSFAAFF